MRKLLLCALLMGFVALSAYHSDPFPLGTYSYIQNGTPFFRENRMEIIRAMKDLGYNINVIETNNSDRNLDELLAALDANGIDAILTDKSWSNDPRDSKAYSVVALATSNFYRFEAEFTDAREVKAGDGTNHTYWYGNSGTIPRTGKAVSSSNASYQNVWLCKPGVDRAGWAYTDLAYRWNDRQNRRVKLTDEIRFHKTHQDTKLDRDSLYVTYRVRLGNLGEKFSDQMPLLTFNVMGYLGNSVSYTDSVFATHYRGKQSGERTVFTWADYKALGSPRDFFDITIALSYNDLRASGLMSDDLDNNPNTPGHWWWYVMRHFAPRLYWHGNCDLELDYIEIQDQLYRNMKQNPDLYRERINARIREHKNLPHGHIIKYTYSMDEPFQGQLESFNLMQSLIDADNPPLVSASYDIKYREFKMTDSEDYWQKLSLIRRIAKPRFFMPDIYPIKPGLSYDPASGERFIQTVLDQRLLQTYRDSKLYAMSDPEIGRKFFPVAQAFGYWNGKQWESWTLPPTATQKALQYLPLCYGPDGLFNYQLQGAVDASGVGYYAPIVGVSNQKVRNEDYTRAILMETNPKVKRWGEELLQYKWMNANTIMTDKPYPEVDLSGMNLTGLKVLSSGKGDYEGYIQVGYYKNTEGEVALFAVNRRTDKYIADAAYRSPDHVAPADYSKAFSQYDPQTLVLDFGKDTIYPAILDEDVVIPARSNSVLIPLAAGEGKLLKLVSTLPSTLKSKAQVAFNNKTYISGTVTIEKKASLTCDKDGELILLPGSTLIIKKGGTFILRGKLSKQEGSRIVSDGKLIME